MGFWSRAAWFVIGGPLIGQAKEVWDRYVKPRRVPPGALRAGISSTYGRALPLVYGKNRISVLVIDEWTANDVTQNMVALCEGPIYTVGRTWKDKQSWDTPIGAGVQTWAGGYLHTEIGTAIKPFASSPTHELAYRGVAVAWQESSDARSSLGDLREMSMEVAGFLSQYGGPDGDAHPSEVIVDLLTDEKHGLGWPTSRVVTAIGTNGSAFTSFDNYVESENFWISPVLGEQKPTQEHIRSILASVNGEAVQREGKLWIVPLGDQTKGTYAPETAAQYALGDGDLITSGSDDPVEVGISPLDDTYNGCPVEFLERAPAGHSSDPAYAYNPAVVDSVVAQDVDDNGERKSPPVPMHMITNRDHAMKIARILSQQSSQIRNTYTFTIPWRFCRLEPLDLVSLTDTLLGIENVPVRVMKITHSGEDGSMKIEAEDWPPGVASSVLHDTQTSDGVSSLAIRNAAAEEDVAEPNDRANNNLARPIADSNLGYYRGNSDGAPVLMDPALVADDPYLVGQRASNRAATGVYVCVTAGDSHASDDLSGTGTGITNGTSVWDYVGTVASQERIVITNELALNPGTGFYYYRFGVQIRPRTDFDNLDALQVIEFAVYPAAGAASPLETVTRTPPDRRYIVPGTTGDDANVGTMTLEYGSTHGVRNASAPNLFEGYFRIALSNSLGRSTRDYGPGPNDTTSAFPGGATISGAGAPPEPDEDPVGGGTCPAPETLIRTAEGTEKPAGDLRPGDGVWTMPEIGGRFGAYRVEAVSIHESERLRVVMRDGRDLVASPLHRVQCWDGWRHIKDLLPGDFIDGDPPGEVLRVEDYTRGPVVRITVETARTYLAAGLLSHNLKPRDP